MATNSALNPTSNPTTDNVTVRIIILAQGNRTQDDLYLVLNLATTIRELRERVQHDLSSHPAPEIQRLIYEGRPLLDNNATLRQTLRLDQRSSGGDAPSYTIHLVIRQEPGATNEAQAQIPQNVPTQHVHNHNENPIPAHVHVPLAVAPPLPLSPAIHDPVPHGMLDPHEIAHNLAHNQMHDMQHMVAHQLAVQNAQRAAFEMFQARVGAGIPLQAQAPVLPQLPHMQPRNVEPTLPQPPAITPNTQSGAVETRRTQDDRVPNTANVQGLTPAVTNPTDRPASAPGTSSLATSDASRQITNPPTTRVIVQTGPVAVPAGLPYPPNRTLPPPFTGIFPRPPPTMSENQTGAWIINSPVGPQAIVFAPGHGYFSTGTAATRASYARQPQPTPTQHANTQNTYAQSQDQPVNHVQAANAQIARPVQPTPLQPGARLEPQAQAQARAPAGNQVQAQAPRAEQNDGLNFIIQRGWLFLRLYMFIFVLSESGTWRRILMLGSAMIFCLLPRQNPLNDAFAMVRRHFDNLIGPPDLGRRNQDQRGADQAHAQEDNTTAATNNGQPRPTRTLPTPEETARRLLAQQEQRSPNIVLNALRTLERAVVLFLASLIPGVGERHVRAREEARRIVDEQERRQREEEEQRQQREQRSAAENKPGDANTARQSDISTPAANTTSGTTATGAEVNDTAGSDGVRLRNTG